MATVLDGVVLAEWEAEITNFAYLEFVAVPITQPLFIEQDTEH